VASNQLSKTERVLRIFTEVRPGEGPTALLMFANVFLILCAYYFIKPLREGWLSISGIEGLKPIEVKAYSSFAQALLLLPIFVIAVLFAQDIMVVLFGPAYAEGAPIFRVYMLIVPLSVLLASPMLRATADLRVMLLADFASLVVAVGSLLLLIGPLGPLGAVASLVIARATYIALATGRTAHRLQLSPRNLLPWRGLIMMLLVASATGLLASALTTGLHPVLRVFLGGGLAFVAYGTIVFFTGLVPESERDLLVAILRRTGVARILSRGSDAGPE